MNIIFIGQQVPKPKKEMKFKLQLNQLEEFMLKNQFLDKYPEFEGEEIEIVPVHIVVRKEIK